MANEDISGEDIEAPSIISKDMELKGELEDQRIKMKKTLKKIPPLEKADINLDSIYSDYQNVELQLNLERTYNKVNSPMRKVGDYLDVNHVVLKDREISYKEIANALGLTESQVYSAVQKLQAYEKYTFVFHPTRKKHTTTSDYGSFRYSADDYVGWSKENDIREKVITRKIIVIRKSQDKIFPQFKDRIIAAKKNKIQELKNRISILNAKAEKKEEDEEDED